MRIRSAVVLGLIAIVSIGLMSHATGPRLERDWTAPAAPSIIKALHPLEPAYGHPMVPGGIHSARELLQYAWLYPGLDLTRVHEDIVTHSYLAYVSYRYRGITRWTKHTRLISKGERILTDGNLVILERCGNMVSGSVPSRFDVLPYEPGDIYPTEQGEGTPNGIETVENWRPSPDSVPEVPLSTPGSSTTNATSQDEGIGVPFVPAALIATPARPSATTPIYHRHPIAIYTATHPIDVPEPPTYLTLSFGLLVAYVLCKRILP